jgi:hypothetical protein
MNLTIANQTYRIGKLNALTQFHVVRRLGPVLATMGVSMGMLKQGASLTTEGFMDLLGPITGVLAQMSNEDTDYIIFTCLSAVTRQQGDTGYAPVSTAGRLMFEDIDLPAMLRLVVEVLKVNLGNFLMELPGETNTASS